MLLPPLRIRKSAGIRVTPAVHRFIRQGNAARDAARWHEAASAFRAALATQPSLHHVWVQLGHALKQASDLDEADEAYAKAAALWPYDAEPVLHRAHLAKQRGRLRAAARLFITALATENGRAEAEAELIAVIARVAVIPPYALHAVLREVQANPTPLDAGEARSDTRPLLFDITDLVGHFRYQRLPTGIQRVQLEVLRSALATHDERSVTLCCFVSGREGWIGIPLERYRPLAELASIDGDTNDPAWQIARARLFFHLALDDQLEVPSRAILLNLGTSLWVADYFRYIRSAKSDQGISYIPFVHDLIPVRVPEYCVRGITEEFTRWLLGVFEHADGFLVNSHSTAADLAHVAMQLGRAMPANRIEVVPLDADFRSAGGAPLPALELSRWGLIAGSYALLVSTIEPRKNHLLAFEAWLELIRIHGADAVPPLVCVGRDGWMNESIFQRLAADAALMAAVTVIHHVSDAELALLYRGSCFTLYPSHYEGWGLPVTESLCHGRIPVVADNSSLREAGAGYAVMFESGSVRAFVSAIEQVAFDSQSRARRQAQIAAEFAPREWRVVARQILSATSLFAKRQGSPPTPEAKRGRYYSVRLHQETTIWREMMDGEAFRVGMGWLWPEPDRCRTRPGGAVLRMRVSPDEEKAPLRLHLRLRGLSKIACAVTIRVGGDETNARVLPDQSLWVACDIPSDPSLSIEIVGAAEEFLQLSTGGASRMQRASIGVAGFFLARQGDEGAAQKIIGKIESWRQSEGQPS